MGQKLGQPLVNDTLHRLSENFLTAQEQGQDLRKRFDTLELSAEAAASSFIFWGSSALPSSIFWYSWMVWSKAVSWSRYSISATSF